MNLAELLESASPDQRAAIIALRDEVTAHGVSNAKDIVTAHDGTKEKLKAAQEQLRADRVAHAEAVAKLKTDFAYIVEKLKAVDAQLTSDLADARKSVDAMKAGYEAKISALEEELIGAREGVHVEAPTK